MDIIKNAWNLQCHGSPSYIWKSKLRRVRFVLENWVKNEQKNPSHLKKKLKGDLVALHTWMEVKEVTPTILIHENELNGKISRSARQEEEELIIKSKKLWLKFGDNNTEYFHKPTKS